MTRVALPVSETVQFTPLTDGGAKIEKMAVLAESKLVRTTIGGTEWSYAPQEAKCETAIEVRPDGLVKKFNASQAAVLSTTLSLGMDIPIQMTIRQSRELSRR